MSWSHCAYCKRQFYKESAATKCCSDRCARSRKTAKQAKARRLAWEIKVHAAGKVPIGGFKELILPHRCSDEANRGSPAD